MNNNLKIALKLAGICFIAVVLLGVSDLLTKSTIERNEADVEEQANLSMMPGCTFSEKIIVDNTEMPGMYYYKVTKNNVLAGYIISVIGNGYGGAMKVMIAVDKNLKVVDMRLLSNSETPGIGSLAKFPEYMEKFKGSNTPARPFPTKKTMLSPADADAITGATITFNGISAAADIGLSIMKEVLSQGD